MNNGFIGNGSNGVWARICGQCHVVLSNKNTGELGSLQPDCNDCTEKNNCFHKYHKQKKICILCGFKEKNER